MNIDKLASILKAAGVVTIDGSQWEVDLCHPELDMPASIEKALKGEDDDDHLSQQDAWWKSISVCDSNDTAAVDLIRALCTLAGVRVRIV